MIVHLAPTSSSEDSSSSSMDVNRRRKDTRLREPQSSCSSTTKRLLNNTMSQPQPRFFPTLQDYSFARQFISDTVAGLTVGSLAVPQSMSYAMIAGLPVQNGLYSDLQIAYPILGASRHLVVGPVAIMSLLTMGALKGTGVQPFTHEWIVLCALLSCCVGIVQSVLSLLGLGARLSNAVSENTIKAFTACAALTIASTQIHSLLGLKQLGQMWTNPNWETLMVSASSLLILEGVRVVFKTSLVAKMGSLLVLISGCLFMAFVGPPSVETIGFIPQGLPKSTPMWSFLSVLAQGDHLLRVALYSVPISLIGFAEAFAIAKAKQTSMSEGLVQLQLDPNKELAALGMANVWTAFLGGYACTGSFSRSAVNAEAGSTSGMSNLVAALVVVVVLQVLTMPLSHLPKACVASVVLSAILRLCDYQYAKHLYLTRKWADLAVYVLVFVCGLAAGVEIGLLIGFGCDTVLSRFATSSSQTNQHYIEEKVELIPMSVVVGGEVVGDDGDDVESRKT